MWSGRDSTSEVVVGEKAEGMPEQPSKAGDVGYIEVKTFR